MSVGVYIIRNTINGKLYVGSSNNLKYRIARHLYMLKSSTHYNRHLQAAFDKYGQDAFQFQIVEECSIEEQIAREEYYTQLHKALDPSFGYNLAPHPFQGARGVKWSEASRAQLSNTLKQTYASGQRVKIFVKHNEQTRKRIGEAGKGRISANRRAIWCHQTGREYSSLHQAAAELRLSVSTIGDVVTGRHKSAYGFTFEYAEVADKVIRPKKSYSRAVVCLETGIVYDSPSEAAKAIGVAGGEIGRSIRNDRKIKGKTFIYEDQEK
jgi:group I intron endonuclease